jgi:hypothetical protein
VTDTMAALVLTNLVYVVGAIVVASLVSGLYVLRRRKPKSLESGIESFSRELRALAPEQRLDDERGVRPQRSGVADIWVQPVPARGSRRRTRGAVATAARRGPAVADARTGDNGDQRDAVADRRPPDVGATASDHGAHRPDDGGATTSGGRSG